MNDQSHTPVIAAHGAAQLPLVEVESYNVEAKDGGSFLGDSASTKAFRSILEDWRKTVRKYGEDPLGDDPSSEISKKKLDKALLGDDLEAASLVHGTVEDFAQALARVIARFLKLKQWKKTERIAIGGGLRASRVGELAIARAALLLRADGTDIDLKPIRHDPDEAGLIGAMHLAPSWLFKGYDGILAVDIGGTNIRAGIVRTTSAGGRVEHSELWRHRDEKPSRTEAVKKLISMLEGLISHARKNDIKLAPFIGIGCPGVIQADGSIERGSQNLPGDWTSETFHLPTLVREAIPDIDSHETVVLMHNDAVVQGLSELPDMQDVDRWGVLTIGTGLGNACFSNRKKKER